ncbi:MULTISPECIES: dolichyl-phosphate-mannose--protein mannosyltransferase [Streptomyces]|uniref:Polyprenol-phosphate-mannose--protein mannosyltransferase n=1 Tax=Streptomyces evansiae TaxID=3075535 RepID=A0ABU2R7D0_9ACTN|nr:MULTISPECIES: phospholipid carrier-dependent glycosyltransferase [unclassified Streptomyces]MDT0412598.1 phospholipid carrier-dependent glycosyltransferase [Streptomyces sp. DSM 41979]MYQ61539.1 phospholipid carrier-dependent glycosyltransferase [Streptomyces sp. SID4926]
MTSTASSTEASQGQAADPQAPPPWQRRLRRFGYVPRRREASVAERLDPPWAGPADPGLWTAVGLPYRLSAFLVRSASWLGPLLITLVAGITRFWHLGSPKAVIFDETYYAKDAWALIHRGYEVSWGEQANKQILADPSTVDIPTQAAYVVHPPVGKYVIGIGEWLFGLTPFGWRFMTAVLGTASVWMLCRIGRRMFRSTFLGCFAGALLTIDGLHLVMSRTALLDLVLMFFVLAAFGCLLLDRDRARARLLAKLPVDADGVVRADATIAETAFLGRRPWRWAAGICLGLAFGTKWNGLFVLAAFGVMTVLWDVGARKIAGARPGRGWLGMLRRDAPVAFVSIVPVALAVYLASWTAWIASPDNGKGGYLRDWARTAGQGGHFTWLPDWLRSLWHYEHEVYRFHVGLTDGHRYQSNAWSWMVDGRPVSYFYESPPPGSDGCPSGTSGDCAREVLALGTPALWWAACAALVYVLWRWVFRRDWRAGAILGAVAIGWLPWLHYQERTIFYFYAVVFVPFLCLALTMLAGALLGPAGASERRRTIGATATGVLFLLIAWNFVYFWPLYTGTAIPYGSWHDRMWLNSWI